MPLDKNNSNIFVGLTYDVHRTGEGKFCVVHHPPGHEVLVRLQTLLDQANSAARSAMLQMNQALHPAPFFIEGEEVREWFETATLGVSSAEYTALCTFLSLTPSHD